MPGLVSLLVAELDEAGIPYCHWKGAAALECGLRGERDLDLLVAPDDYPRAVDALLRTGWRQATRLVGKDDPGTSHFFGHDPAVDRLLHVHLHDRVLTGENLINSHELPLGGALIEGSVLHEGVRTAPPEGVAAIGVLKAAIRWGSLPDRLASLLGRSSKALDVADGPALKAAAVWLRAHGPVIDDETFRACAASLRPESSRRVRRSLSRRVRAELRPWARYGRVGRGLAYLRWLVVRLLRLARGDRSDRVLASGAAWIVFIAPSLDSVGGATAVGRWLGRAVAVRTFRCSPWRGSRPVGEGRVSEWAWRARRTLHQAARAADKGIVALTDIPFESIEGSVPGDHEALWPESLLVVGARRPDAVVQTSGMAGDAVRARVWAILSPTPST